MSELEKAKQEVEQVCFAYDKAGDTGDIKDWKGFYDLENKLIEKVKIANQPSLTIPKSIAEKTVGYFDKDRPNYFERSTRFVFSNWSSDLNGDNFDDSEFNKRIQIVGAYLNPLTRNLVKVVEG
ncbi:hypothetical protein M5C73_08820 [Lactococcus lactis]|uniref:hypothetical protein n=1 Tax=Lactococcus lactis TaxID=1358 RepID=UPI002078BF09|nr:hypothetical protein [Lactococcus lactis]USI47468.1 hypothetical protein M5C73_08820 [Lactococcus lactis]